MSLVLLLLVLLGFAGLGGSSSGFSSAGSGPAPEAKLQLVDRKPLTVRGSGFQPGERVALKVVLRKPQRKPVQANARGAFRASFGVPVTRCDLVRVLAIRSGGRRVVLKLLPPPACKPVRAQ